MANNYVARIKAQIDSANLQTQINKIVQSTSAVKKGINITPTINTAQTENQINNLVKTITTKTKSGSQQIANIYKSMGSNVDTTFTKIGNETVKIVEDYSSAQKRVTKQQQQMENALLQTQKRRREEAEKLARAQAKAINKNQEQQYQKELKLQQKINVEYNSIKTKMEEAKLSTSKRVELEEKLKNIMASQNSTQKLQDLKNMNTQLNTMGKSAMSLGEMLKTAYQKFANKIATLYRNVHRKTMRVCR